VREVTGPNRHYIWQMFQRGFLDESSEPRQPWIYEKGNHPKQVSTKSYGAEEYFYTDNADESVRQFENKHASFVQKARSASDGADLDTEKSARLITSLEMRTKSVRDNMISLGSKASSTLAGDLRKIRSSSDFSNFMKKNLGDVEGESKELLSAALDSISKSGLEIDHESLFNLKEFESLLENIIPSAARNAQSKSLELDVNKTDRYRFHLMKNYVARKIESHLILPDTYIAFIGRDFIGPFIHDKDYQECILPINSTTYLYGFKSGGYRRNVNTINRILASCANQSFIAGANDKQLEKLTGRIGKNTLTYSKNDFRNPLRN